jgi:osmotically inducible protein OsmC
MVSAAVGIGPHGEGGFGLVVDLDVELSGLSATDADRLVRAAHAVCPYSNAVKGNVDVRLTTHTAVPA